MIRYIQQRTKARVLLKETLVILSAWSAGLPHIDKVFEVVPSYGRNSVATRTPIEDA